MSGLLDTAISRLKSNRGDIHVSVHSSRKDLKAFRAYLRLLRAIIGDDSFRRLNISARDASRILSQARDTVALHDAITLVEKHLRRTGGKTGVSSLRKAADSEVRTAAGPAVIRRHSRDVIAMLLPCHEEVATWTLPEQPDPYIEGLIRTYATARKMLRRGLKSRMPEDMHEARKRVIHWRYQLDLFIDLWPRLLKAEVRDLQELREDLGQHNDLVMLEGRILNRQGGFADIGDPDPFLDAITLLRARCAHIATYREGQLFAQPPDIRQETLRLWWKAAFDYRDAEPHR